MTEVIILGMYLGDSLFAEILPVASGPFAIAAIILYFSGARLYKGVVSAALLWFLFAMAVGILGAKISGTPLGMLSFATPILLFGIWVVGAGRVGSRAILITPKGAFIGVMISCFFLGASYFGFDVMSRLKGSLSGRPSGIYYEASHLALYVMPLWLIAFGEKRYRVWLYLSILPILILSFSTTLAAFLMLYFLTALYLKTGKRGYGLGRLIGDLAKIAIIAVPVYLASSVVTVKTVPVADYVSKRIMGLFDVENRDVTNLSSLVVVQGVELAQHSFVESRGLGVGLGNLGTSTQILNKTLTRELISALLRDGGDLNLRDGGLLINKIVGEVGFQSFLIPFLLVIYFRRIKAIDNADERRYHATFGVSLVCFLFVRVLPYFSAPVVLSLFSLASLLNKRPLKTLSVSSDTLDVTGRLG